MPSFVPPLTQHDVDAIAAYLGQLQEPVRRGGAGLGLMGPVTETLVAMLATAVLVGILTVAGGLLTAGARADAFEGDVPAATEATGRGCPFGAMLNEQAGESASTVRWSPEAEARVERIPSFIRPMARKAIERFAEAQGRSIITEAVMDEACGALGM